MKRSQITWRSYLIAPVPRDRLVWPTKHDVRLQPRSQEEAGKSQTTDIRIANDALSSTLILSAIM